MNSYIYTMLMLLLEKLWLFRAMFAIIGRTDVEAETPILRPPDVKNWLLGKDPDAGKDWRQEEKGTTDDEMVGWHYRLDGHEFEQALGVGDGQGSLECCRPGAVRHDWATELTDTIFGLLWWLSYKETAYNAGDAGDMCSIPRLGRSPGEGHGNPLQYSCLENPMDRGAWWATVYGVAKSWTQLSTDTSMRSIFIYQWFNLIIGMEHWFIC